MISFVDKKSFVIRKSVTSFFAAYDALCEEGTATPVCKALDEVADISVPGKHSLELLLSLMVPKFTISSVAKCLSSHMLCFS